MNLPEAAPPALNRAFRVLALDGGGVRGLYTASVLQTLEGRFCDATGADVGKGFDLITGTSTGGILACALAHGLPIKRVVDLYCEHGPKIFADPMPEMADGWGFWQWCWRHRNTAGSPVEPLRAALTDLFSETTLAELYRARRIALCVPSVHVLKEKARVFKTPHDSQRTLDQGFRIVDVCLATSAAPIFLPLATLPAPGNARGTDAFVDGGLWANNPVLIGLIEALQIATPEQPIEIISIGTSAVPAGSVFDATELDRGLKQWRVGAEALALSMNAQADGARRMAELLAVQLGRLGKSVSIYRLPESAPSPHHMKHLGLDRASDKALETLMQLGRHDALEVYGLCLRTTDSGPQMVQRIFNAMPSSSPAVATI
jgi:uncharacterized protein